MKIYPLVCATAAVLTFALPVACTAIPQPVIDMGVCTAGKLDTQIALVKGQVFACLANRDYASCIDGLGRTVGMDVVLCAVREFTGVGAGPGTDPAVSERARAYLGSKGVRP